MKRTLILTIDTDIPDGLYPDYLLEPGMLVDVILGEGGLVGQVVAIEASPAPQAGALQWLAAPEDRPRRPVGQEES